MTTDIAPACSREFIHYTIARTDIPTGLAGASILHASGETGPCPPGSIAILLAAKDEAELRALAALDPSSHPIMECDGRFKGQLMAIGFPPCLERKPHFDHLPLWRGGST